MSANTIVKALSTSGGQKQLCTRVLAHSLDQVLTVVATITLAWTRMATAAFPSQIHEKKKSVI